MKKRPSKKKILGIVLAVAVLLIIIGIGVAIYAYRFLSAETSIRDDWSVKTGTFLLTDEELNISVFEDSIESSIEIVQILPEEYQEADFTFYEESVQERLAASIVKMSESRNCTMDNPLAVINPFGTASNGLYLHFSTNRPGTIRYTIHVEDDSIPDYTAEAWEGEEFRKHHEFQIIGLVPGMENQVTMELMGANGKVLDSTSFTVTMPETVSGYSVRLESSQGSSDGELSPGLYSLIRVGGHNGYAFFYDNSGVLRYEMVLEGYSLDRILWHDQNMLTCVSAYKLAEFNPLGQVVAVYDTGKYELHHDMVMSGTSESVLALASDTEDELNLEDLLIEISLTDKTVTQLIDFKDIFPDYYENEASPLTVTDEFFWLAGKKDWIHLNTVQYIEEDDSVIVSSRETSTIIKIRDIHQEPALDYLIGDEQFWKGTPYEPYSFSQDGQFVPQYGQHTVEYHEGENLEEGQYYLLMYNNNYWENGTRDGYTPKLSESVGTALTSSTLTSQVYLYLVDENARSFSLVNSFDVPYSSIVSNVTPSKDNYVVNSGTSKVFGEYDADGNLIREFSYDCDLQTYRVMKNDFYGFWFSPAE